MVEEVAGDRFVSEYFGFPPVGIFYQCSIFIFIVMGSYQKDKRAKPGNRQIKPCYFGHQRALDTKIRSHGWVDGWIDGWMDRGTVGWVK
jgi:hypothetical protein